MKIPSTTKAVLFDMDGVLFNTEDLAHKVFSSLSKKFDYPFQEQDHKAILGSSEDFWSHYMIDRLKTDVTAAQFASLFWNELQIEANQHLNLMPGVLNCFQVINQIGLKKCLVSSSHRLYIEKLLNKFEILDQFDFIVAGEDTKHGKPSPEPYLLAVELLQLSENQCSVIEDSLNGVHSAKLAGCHVIAVPTVHSIGIDYSEADIVINNLDDIKM